MEEHNRRLFAVLDRLRQVGLSRNGNKCQFRLSKLRYVASVERPIQELTRKGVKFVWGEEQQTAFERLKQLITHTDTLAY